MKDKLYMCTNEQNSMLTNSKKLLLSTKILENVVVFNNYKFECPFKNNKCINCVEKESKIFFEKYNSLKKN